jgi:ComF family protein
MDARGLLDGFLDLIFPRRCVACRAPGAWLCAGCAAQLVELPERRCRRCGAPGSRSDGRLAGPCPECDGRELAFSGAAAAFVYEGPARALVTACKFRALRSIAAEMSALAAPAFAAACGVAPATDDGRAVPATPPVDLVTWVPGHRDRSLERGFNQAELLGRGLARSAGLPAAPLILRTRHGARQSGLDRVARAANVDDAFALREDASRVLTNLKRVVIVDDVYTTGETLNHCARVLEHTGTDLLVFTFARTVRARHARSPRSITAPSPAASSRASLHPATLKERCR